MYFGKIVELVLLEDLFNNLLYLYMKLFLLVILFLNLIYEKICKRFFYDVLVYNYSEIN